MLRTLNLLAVISWLETRLLTDRTNLLRRSTKAFIFL